MAIIYERGKEQRYTGADLFMKKAGDFFSDVKRKTKKVATAIPDTINRQYGEEANLRRTRNTEMIQKAFGSTENYQRLLEEEKKLKQK